MNKKRFMLTLVLIIVSIVSWSQLAVGDTWITLWNKLDEPLRLHCWRESTKKPRSFKSKLVEADDRYDIKGMYPKKPHKKYYRHWCHAKAENGSIKFDVFGGKDKRLNRMSDSYSDWIINSGGIYRLKKSQLTLYYGKNWLGGEHTLEDDLAGTPEKELNPDDFTFIAELNIDTKTANLPLDQQRYAITKATYASHKFENNKDASRYVKAAMQKKFGQFWEVFVEQKGSNKIVKQTCDMKNIMEFSVNDIHFIVCKIMR